MPWTSLRWNLYAPIYNLGVSWFTARPRQESLASLRLKPQQTVLVSACGTGLDFRYLPRDVDFHALDASEGMLRQARKAAQEAGLPQERVVAGDAMALPFPDASLDAVVLHFILGVADRPDMVLAEALRVLKPGGQAAILDKGVRPGTRPGWMRRVLNPILKPFATDITLDLDRLAREAGFEVEDVTPMLSGYFFRVLGTRV